MKNDKIRVRIVADTRDFRAQLLRCRLLFPAPWYRRAAYRFALWRIGRERDPA